MKLEEATVLTNDVYQGEYRHLQLDAPSSAGAAVPGQFVHLRVPWLEETALRRPFSIFDAADGKLSILYKPVGRGTRLMLELVPGKQVSVLGPLGNGFPLDIGENLPVAVAGGYGVAPLSFLAAHLPRPGVIFVGGRSAIDILCTDRFEALGWEVHVATEDGSLGSRGLVTDVLTDWAARRPTREIPTIFACGPDGMLRAVGDITVEAGWKGWLSLDKRMGCGVGACLACVQDIRQDDGTIRRKRVCHDGPIFAADSIVWKAEV